MVRRRRTEHPKGSLRRYLYLPFEIKELHELRILAKRLRSAIELFAVCWGEEAEAIAKEIALLQTSLGELPDCDIWINDLSARLKRTARKPKSDQANLELRNGAAWLLRHFARERMEHYRRAGALGAVASRRIDTATHINPRSRFVAAKGGSKSSCPVKSSLTGP